MRAQGMRLHLFNLKNRCQLFFFVCDLNSTETVCEISFVLCFNCNGFVSRRAYGFFACRQISILIVELLLGTPTIWKMKGPRVFTSNIWGYEYITDFAVID